MLLQNKWVNENLGFSGEYALSLTISNLFTHEWYKQGAI